MDAEHRTRTITRTTRIRSSPHAVFQAVHSPEIAPLIDPGVKSWTPDRHPIGLGTRFSIRAQLGVVPIRGVSEIVSWDPPTSVVYRSVKPSWPMSMTAVHRCEPDGPEHTNYTWEITFHERHVLARPGIAMAVRLFSTAMERQSAALTRYLET